jgi:hypothetical protein
MKICWRLLYKNSFYIFIETLDEIFKKLPSKYTLKNIYFLLLEMVLVVCFHPCSLLPSSLLFVSYLECLSIVEEVSRHKVQRGRWDGMISLKVFVHHFVQYA